MVTRTPDPGVPADYDPAQFPAFAVTVDVVVLSVIDARLHVLLVRRHGIVPPFELGDHHAESAAATPVAAEEPA